MKLVIFSLKGVLIMKIDELIKKDICEEFYFKDIEIESITPYGFEYHCDRKYIVYTIVFIAYDVYGLERACTTWSHDGIGSSNWWRI
jgi:hypothetical protein